MSSQDIFVDSRIAVRLDDDAVCREERPLSIGLNTPTFEDNT